MGTLFTEKRKHSKICETSSRSKVACVTIYLFQLTGELLNHIRVPTFIIFTKTNDTYLNRDDAIA